ncbi:hypothetical protein ASE36_21300 [Rhizobium sp. Root274]|uniref:D-alanyl-D-alanine carboxypeptidase n=1 Tax=unclassified Rhizobium TaxID=2613769 RepID=UPI0007161535|nr:D-alanyl-D-alanine carboxypeptidase [Rhizobium sp. Root1240]KQW25472.1 hypothetical protein ASC71_21360 [Rhizobium sp. Root1240]KRD26092.1 hypothetical protein ASE36_21300 [Rhizobium sp. Root274]
MIAKVLGRWRGVARRGLFLAMAGVISTGLTPVHSHANVKYAGIVIDAKTGRTLYADQADAPRFPASLTKMMTLYLTFDALQRGQISKRTRMPVSRNAAAEVPTKLGLRAGQSITVEQAILGLVTRSANDAATVLGEFLEGSEAAFAAKMTSTARSLGMKSTTFNNAHGLPNSRQRTTASDMARLGMALRDHFPEYYDYFRTRSFTYNGRTYGNHNRLLGKVKGVDGIKTGFIRASGFNLVTSLESEGRSIVAVVMGGRSGRSRNAHMMDLIDRFLKKASTGPDQFEISKPGSDLLVAGRFKTLGDAPVPEPRPNRVLAANSDMPLVGATRVELTSSGPASANEGRRPGIDHLSTGSVGSQWIIQVASMPTARQAREILARIRSSAEELIGRKAAFVQPFEIDGTVYHRARFSGFESKEEARNACAALRDAQIDCYAVRPSIEAQT